MIKNVCCGVVALGVLFLGGCAREKEFTFRPQAGAQQSGQFPNFNVKPKAAAAQFTDAQGSALIKQLNKDSRTIKSAAGANKTVGATRHNANEEAREEAEKALRQIEQSGKSQH